jgi:hypothetical protein
MSATKSDRWEGFKSKSVLGDIGRVDVGKSPLLPLWQNNHRRSNEGLFNTDSSISIRRFMFLSLGDKRAINAFIQALRDSNRHTRMEAAVSLSDLGDPRAVDPLIRVLKENLANLNAVESLAWIADPKLIDVLSQAIGFIEKISAILISVYSRGRELLESANVRLSGYFS